MADDRSYKADDRREMSDNRHDRRTKAEDLRALGGGFRFRGGWPDERLTNRRTRRSHLARRKPQTVDDRERRSARRMTAFFWCSIVSILGLAFAAWWARAAGHFEFEFACGLLAILLIGQFFIWSVVASAKQFGYAWIAGLGTVTKRSHPMAYWSTAAIPILLGIGLTIGVAVAAWRRWVA